jgi:hypothetical protein
MKRLLWLGGLGTLGIGCGSTAVRTATPPPVDDASACEVVAPGGDRLAALRVGDAIHHPALNIDRATAYDFFSTFPELTRDGARIDAVTPAQVDGDPTLELAVLFEQAPLQPDGEPRVVRLAFYDCDGGALTLMPEIVDTIGEAVQVQVMGGQRVARPGGGEVTSLSILAAHPAMEVSMYEFVVGAATPAWPSHDPDGAARGELAAFDTGSQFLVDGLDYARGEAIAGSGWLPDDGAMTYVSLHREQSEGSNPDVASPRRVATMTAAGVSAADAQAPGWLLVGDGPMPAWCGAAPAQLGCRQVAVGASPHVAADWIAGVWSAPAAIRAALAAAGAPERPPGRWVYLGEFDPAVGPDDPAGLPVGPDGKPPLTSLPLRSD